MAPQTIFLAASGTFALASTSAGFWPPNSSSTGVIFSAAALMTILPTLVLPVKKMKSKGNFKSWATSSRPSVIGSIPAHAETDLTGKWVGQFNGIQIEIPPERGPFGSVREEATATQTPRFVEQTLRFDIETQSKGLAAGTWSAGEFKKHFVCAQINQTSWNCIDSGGRGSVEVISPTEIKVCYFDNREGAQGAGCATLRKAK